MCEGEREGEKVEVVILSLFREWCQKFIDFSITTLQTYRRSGRKNVRVVLIFSSCPLTIFSCRRFCAITSSHLFGRHFLQAFLRDHFITPAVTIFSCRYFCAITSSHLLWRSRRLRNALRATRRALYFWLAAPQSRTPLYICTPRDSCDAKGIVVFLINLFMETLFRF